ncbi:hypothetical protein [Inhella gelatinilytica]|uniref:Uncharacterized protein n=1 Tax=Inhella gelatinilytica TaxID=2795030 RepID=A0A931IVM1_9BURK|nr:hypothetical protein [Inhella gelatinilytica]MBH9551819.1 hypothetical protein [Inhella gelatinilytica]
MNPWRLLIVQGFMLLGMVAPSASWALSCVPLTHQAVLVCEGSPAHCTAQFVILEVPDFYCRRHPLIVPTEPGLSAQLQAEVRRTGKSFSEPRLVVAHLTSPYWEAAFNHPGGTLNYGEMLRAHERREVGWREVHHGPTSFWFEERSESPSPERLATLKQGADARARTLLSHDRWHDIIQWALLAAMALTLMGGTWRFIRQRKGPVRHLAGIALTQFCVAGGLVWGLFEVGSHSPVTGWAALGVPFAVLVTALQIACCGFVAWRRRHF